MSDGVKHVTSMVLKPVTVAEMVLAGRETVKCPSSCDRGAGSVFLSVNSLIQKL